MVVPPAISDLLLAPGDFPGRAFARTGFESGQTAQGQPTAIVELAGPGFTLQHSLVIFDEGVSARAALAGAKLQWEQLTRNNDGTTLFRDDLAPLAIADRELVTGVLEEVRAGNVTSSLIFVQGSVPGTPDNLGHVRKGADAFLRRKGQGEGCATVTWSTTRKLAGRKSDYQAAIH